LANKKEEEEEGSVEEGTKHNKWKPKHFTCFLENERTQTLKKIYHKK